MVILINFSLLPKQGPCPLSVSFVRVLSWFLLTGFLETLVCRSTFSTEQDRCGGELVMGQVFATK